jgi:hypothetical protein
MSSALQFANQIANFEFKARNKLNETVQNTLLQAGKFAVYASPVDTGTFAASWNIANNTPDPKITPGWNPRNSKKTDFLPGGRATGLVPSFVDTRLRNSAASLQAGGVAYLTNNTPHAPYVESGSKTTEAQYIVRRIQSALRGWAITSAMQAQAGPRDVQ